MLLLQLLSSIGQLQQVRLLPKSKPMHELEIDSTAVISTTFNNQHSHIGSPYGNLSIDESDHLSSSGRLSPAKIQLQRRTEMASNSAPLCDDKQSSR